MTSVQVKSVEKPSMGEMLTRIKQIQASLVQLQASVNRLAQQDIDMDSIKPKIIEAFDVDFIKQVCYEIDINNNMIKLIVIFSHNNFDLAVHTIVDKFGKLEDKFPNVYMELMFFRTSELKPSHLVNTTTVFKRE